VLIADTANNHGVTVAGAASIPDTAARAYPEIAIAILMKMRSHPIRFSGFPM
jgi:hypothetical protein